MHQQHHVIFGQRMVADFGGGHFRQTVETAQIQVDGAVQQAGYQLVTIPGAEIEHPTAPRPLIHYRLANRSYFYEPGIPVERQYYKMRNWAWLHRLKAPRNYPGRLMLCGVYILFSLNAMLQCNELGIKRVYNLFRALHNGFYGKLRPY